MSQQQSTTRKAKKLAKQQNNKETNVVSLNLNMNLINVKPITQNQRKAFEAYNSDKNLVMYGYPGTGKTFIALYLALNSVLQEKQYKKVCIIRSAVPSRQIGFLPGGKNEKSQVYELPYINACTELFGRGDAYTLLKNKKVIEFEITSFLRGMTFDDTVIIIDEWQNLTWEELYTTLTRVGTNSKVILSGDLAQCDLTKEQSGYNMMYKVFSMMKNDIHMQRFEVEDIIRSDFVKSLIIANEKVKQQSNVPTSTNI